MGDDGPEKSSPAKKRLKWGKRIKKEERIRSKKQKKRTSKTSFLKGNTFRIHESTRGEGGKGGKPVTPEAGRGGRGSLNFGSYYVGGPRGPRGGI